MNKKQIIKQLENIQSLMECDIFYIDEDLASDCLACNGTGEGRSQDLHSDLCEACDGSGIEEEYKDECYNNDDMYNGITKAIELLKGGK